ncbi:MAG: YeeE/YedE family protein [Rhodovarius sp.]|nr:YeeE/YedE family protein [Rhodovarius sp.]
MFPIRGDGALVLAVVFGAIFGALLHRGRVLDYNVIVNQLRLRDFTVLKVMLTAIIVGGIGVFLLVDAGAARFALRDANLLAVSLGAAIFGVGMVLYGYCPGTGLAATATGSLHAGVGVVGMLVGAVLYALSFDWVRTHILPVGALGKVTLMDVTGIPAAWIFAGLVVIAISLFAWAERSGR